MGQREEKSIDDCKRRRLLFNTNADADVNICTTDNKSPLMSACEDGYYKIVKQLLRRGANVTKRDGNGQTAYAKAKENRHDTLLPMLIDANKGNKEEFKD